MLRNPQAAEQEIQRMVDRIEVSAQPAIQATDRDAMVAVLVNGTGMDRAEAEQAVERWQATYHQSYASAQSRWEQLKAQADEAGQAAAEAAAAAAWCAFFVLLLGAIAAALGANIGSNRLMVRARDAALIG